jgi:hypothetical protein
MSLPPSRHLFSTGSTHTDIRKKKPHEELLDISFQQKSDKAVNKLRYQKLN